MSVSKKSFTPSVYAQAVESHTQRMIVLGTFCAISVSLTLMTSGQKMKRIVMGLKSNYVF
jgi:hypothetical protein